MPPLAKCPLTALRERRSEGYTKDGPAMPALPGAKYVPFPGGYACQAMRIVRKPAPQPRSTRRVFGCSVGSDTRTIETNDTVLGPCGPGIERGLPDRETVRAHVVEEGTELAIEEPKATSFSPKLAKCR